MVAYDAQLTKTLAGVRMKKGSIYLRMSRFVVIYSVSFVRDGCR